MYDQPFTKRTQVRIEPIQYGNNWIKATDRYDVFRGEFPQQVMLNDLTDKILAK